MLSGVENPAVFDIERSEMFEEEIPCSVAISDRLIGPEDCKAILNRSRVTCYVPFEVDISWRVDSHYTSTPDIDIKRTPRDTNVSDYHS